MKKMLPYVPFIAGLLLVSTTMAETVIRREGLPPIEGSIFSGGKTGLLVTDAEHPEVLIRIPWSTVARIEPTQPRPQLQGFLKSGALLWRAKNRLLRGDVQLSEPIFASQFTAFAGSNCEDARVASEGLLRVLIARGALDKAILPWLETVRLDELGVSSPFDTLEPILDPSTKLCPHLPVMALDATSLNAAKGFTPLDDSSASLLAQLLVTKANPAGELHTPKENDHSFFIAQLFEASSGSQRTMQNLTNQLVDYKPWQQIWSHYALGIGYLQVDSAPSKDMGLLHLAIVCSTDPARQPWLRGAAMIRLSTELKNDGLDLQADRILNEAKRHYPSHPLLLHFEEKQRNIPQ